MKHFRKGTISFLLFLGLICLGCKKNKNSNNNDDGSEIISTKLNKNFRILEGNKRLDYKLPDTVALNDTIKGYIVYKSQFDTIKKMHNENHFVNLYFANTNMVSENFSVFQSKKYNTFARIHDSLLLINNIVFKKKGNHLLEGYIVDYLYKDIDSNYVDLKTIENHILYEVYVK